MTPGDLAVLLLHMALSMQTSLAILPSPLLPHDSLSFHLHIQGGHLRCIFHLFLSLLPLKSDDNVMEHHQHCISESITHCSQPTEALNQCTCIFIVAISKTSVLKFEICRSTATGSSQLTLSAFYTKRTTPAQC